jgi:ubiquinone/menaquinone biosynthesis C-methylase UbiE
MERARTGQVTHSVADVYEGFFVPALFQQWALRITRALQLTPGQTVLDIACGTGGLAQEAAKRVGPSGHVIALDRNDGMLAVARRKTPAIEWRRGLAEPLPFVDGAFDAVVSQFSNNLTVPIHVRNLTPASGQVS